MSLPSKTNSLPESQATHHVRTLRTFARFNLGQRWEHTILILSVLVLLLTGLPQKYRSTGWSQQILSTPERLETIQDVHHIAALVLAAEAIYHVGKAIVQLARRRLPGEMLPSLQDLRDAWRMILYLLFISKVKPQFGKYNFEQKLTYWFLFFSIGLLGISGFIQWFPEVFTRILPGGIVPAAKLAHSTEAIVTIIFVVIWHFYHVHIERLNLSIFTGWLNEEDMRSYHALEYNRMVASHTPEKTPGSIAASAEKPESGD